VFALPEQWHKDRGDDRLGFQGGEDYAGYYLVANDNFIILSIKGALDMLNSEGCQELTTSYEAAVIHIVPEDVRKLARWIVRRWWKPHALLEALHQFEAAHTTTVSDTDN
jgi:hypothetical protein